MTELKAYPERADFADRSVWRAIQPYVQIARVDHWFKNAFMLLGIVLAVFTRPEVLALQSVPVLLLAVVTTCLIASSNYVLNEYLDAPLDRKHPTKRFRPAAQGLIRGSYAYSLWIALAVVGLGAGFTLNVPFGLSLLSLWVMGTFYNVPPIRTKDVPYVDVLTESINNPIRLLLGWFALVPTEFPPISLILAYWMAGAFFMAIKRFAEYRHIGDKQVAASYRRSFAHYDDARLLVSIMFYATAGALCIGIFMVRYKLELILSVPFLAGFFAYYMRLGLQPDSPVQNPEKLYKERGFFAYAILAATVFVALMFTDIPACYEMFQLDTSLAQAAR